MPSIEFLLRQKLTPLGVITDPRIPIAIRTRFGEDSQEFLLDTGADFSTAPRSLAEHVGLDWASLPVATIAGVGSETLAVRIGNLPVRLGDIDLTVRCLFIDSLNAPLVLGRADVLGRFAVTLDASAQGITFTELT